MKTRASMSAMLHLPSDIDTDVRIVRDNGAVTVSITGAPGTGDCYTGVTLFFTDTATFDTFVLALADQQQALYVRGSR